MFRIVDRWDIFRWSVIEIKQMQEKIDAGILLAQKRLIEKTKKEDGELVVVRDGKVVRIKARDLK